MKGNVMRPTRRNFMTGSVAAIAAGTTGVARAAIAQAGDLRTMTLPPPITPAERKDRIKRAQEAMQKAGIGAVLVEAGPSLDYFTGVQWWRSERLTGTIIPASGDPIIVTPFFERPSIAEQLAITVEIRTWNEDEEPLKLVADFIRERGAASSPVGMEETNRYFLAERLSASLPARKIVSANPVVRAVRMRKTRGRNRTDAGRQRHHYRRVSPRMAAGQSRHDGS